MKKRINLLCACLLFCVLMIGGKTQYAEAKTYDSTSYKGTDTTITVNWDSPYNTVSGLDPDYYTIDSYRIYDYETDSNVAEGIEPTALSYKVTGLKKGYVGYWRIYYTVTSIYGSTNEYYYDALYVNTTPKKVLKSQFAVFSAYLSTKKCDFEVAKSENMTGYQLKVYKGSTCVKTFNTTSRYTDYFKFSLNQVYKFKVRQYYKNSDTDKKYYGEWSSYRYFEVPGIDATYKYGVKGLNMKFKKVSNVKNYVVYVAKGKSTYTYKKTTTVTVTDSYKTIKLTKYGTTTMKKGTTYYIKVIPTIKTSSGSSVESDICFTTYYTAS